ncbi:hypothetical protein ZWY2020_040512 [Hordeum vulgare]|nr:hypothetical protein ZWY2020_040512 [Hordeum vulgare]
MADSSPMAARAPPPPAKRKKEDPTPLQTSPLLPTTAAAGWSGLPPDLVHRVADSLLATNDLDCYMYLRAACLGWRAATEDPKAKGSGGSDRRAGGSSSTRSSRARVKRCSWDAIVAWISKKLGPAVQNLTTVDEAKKIINGDDMAVLAYLHHLSGAHSDDLAAASRLEYTASFYQTTSPDVAKLFHIDPEAKRSSVVLLKKEEEKLTVFDGEFRVSAIAEFVSANKIPLITTSHVKPP